MTSWRQVPAEINLPNDLVALLDSHAECVVFRKNHVFGRQGRPCKNLWIIVSGQVLLSAEPDGGPHALHLLSSGDLFGTGILGDDRVWLSTSRAVSQGVAYRLSERMLNELPAKCPQLLRAMLGLMVRRLDRANKRLELFSHSSPRDRILGILKIWANQMGRPTEGGALVPFRLTQAQLGDLVGVSREAVSRALGSLESEGKVARKRGNGIWLSPEVLSSGSVAYLGISEFVTGVGVAVATAIPI